MFVRTIKYIAAIAAAAVSVSCSYLDVIPVEQPGTDDMMIDDASTQNFLYSCYGYLQDSGAGHNFDIGMLNQPDFGCDEMVCPQEWESAASRSQWNYYTPSSIGRGAWGNWYDGIGYCNLFLKTIEESNPPLNPNDRAQYIAEVKFLKAYYHFRVLQLYGPCPIIDKVYPTNTAKDEIPGRSHFDYCVDYIVGLLDEAAQYLPPEQPNNSAYFGRATSVICKALKARVLLLAASPLYNGEFPFRSWRNDTYETPGYGKELVSLTYDRTKWERARKACEEAITLAESNGFELFDVEASETLRANQGIPLPQVPGSVDDTFRQKVMMLRYVVTARPDNGNRETLWGVVPNRSGEFPFWMASMPHYILKNNTGVNVGGWGGASPTLYTVENFYTSAGLKPSEDGNFTPESQWFQSAGLGNPDIINLNVGREPRFYAWISFDGDEYSPVLANRSPVVCEMRNPQKTGYDATIWGTRNYCVTGFLNKKHVHPNYNYTGNNWDGNWGEVKTPVPLIRLAELYLIMAECEARLDRPGEALDWLNRIRRRAGVPEWTESSLAAAGKTALDAVLDERFVELYAEGFRYHDIRRCVKGAEYLSANCYMGLNAVVSGPSFTEFNTPVQVAQPFSWKDCMYLLPVDNDEFYSNPQMVQAPGY